jgi:hypothetical protein
MARAVEGINQPQVTSPRDMATLIPSFHSCGAKMTSGERRFAHRLLEKLEDDYLCWYDVPVGRKSVHPHIVILHPRCGLS